MADWLKENSVAAYAAIVATGNLIWTIVVATRDRARITLKYQTGMKVMNSPIYHPDKTYLILYVVNRGTRPVTITSTGYLYFGGKEGGILTGSIMGGPRIIDEQHPSSDFLLEENLIELDRVYYFFAKDAAHRTYILHPHQFARIRQLFWRFLRRGTRGRQTSSSAPN
jgi:hypothetical protein